ncbi:hypothetical protein [Halovenus salina]|uniref:RING-type E3 ubiquitin transferase n=1 Tax=Halovenus salina TaxID=1510225 RepID=A0ABD5W8K7_9EURY|nr:hypothetical protein [Halovenus salina]
MPASQEVTMFEGLTFRVEPVEKPDPVYFTDQAPEFEVTIENDGSEYDFDGDSEFSWSITTDPTQIVHEGTRQFGPLEDGDTETVIIGNKLLAYEGHGTVGIGAAGASGSEDGFRTLRPGRSPSYDPAYSFSVWDRSHYKASIRNPKRLQKALIFTSIVLILFAFIQLLIAGFT